MPDQLQLMKPLRRAGSALLLALSLLGARPAEATPERWVHERVGLLTLEGPPASAAAVRAMADGASRVLTQVEDDLGLRPERAFRMVLVPASGLDDSTLAKIDEAAPPWAAGYMLPELRLGAIRIDKASSYPYGTLESVLAHESAHLILHDAVAGRLPLWFEEGVATAQGRRWSAADAWAYSRALLTSDVPSLAALDTSFHASADEAEIAYVASFSFVSWSERRYGRDFIARILRETKSRPFAAAWRMVAAEPLARAEADWRRASLIRYRWIPVITASSTFWILISLLAIWAGMRRRALARAARERWPDEERAEEPADENGPEGLVR
jgi:hypothetical protein